MTGKVLEGIKEINAWGGIKLIPQIEEKAEDIWLLVTYEDHGDDFVVVGTKDGKCYEYGYWLNRRDFYPELTEWARKPMTYKKEDEYSVLSNRIYREFNYYFKERNGGYRIYNDVDYAQRTFLHFLNFMKEEMEGDTIYVKHGRDYKYELHRWLQANQMDNNYYLEALENTPFDTHVNGFDGVAGKRCICPDTVLYADHFDKIIVNGKKLDRRKVSKPDHTDEWGETTYRMRLDRFHPSEI